MESIVCGNCGASWLAPDMLTQALQSSIAAWARARNNVLAIQNIRANSSLSFRDAQAIVLHITQEPGTCHECSYPLTGEPTDHCPFCQAVNYDW